MAGKACHVVGSATQVGLTQVLGRTSKLSRFTGGVMYFTIEFFVGLVMLGVYWGLPERTTGPTSLGRSALILVSAPFLWPVQIAFYAVRSIGSASCRDRCGQYV